MSDIQIYLLEADKNTAEAQTIAANSASKLEKKELKLLDLITSLDEYINDKHDAGIRSKSVAYLADVLENVSPGILTGQARHLLCDFITGRLEGDAEGAGASARALLALEERGKWGADTAQKVIKTLIDCTHPLRQFKLQTERYPIVRLIDRLLATNRTAIERLHESDPLFMPKFTSYFEGEKDPRNLMVVFSLLHVPMAEWDIRGNAQDMFEAVFNYFPITFKPPPDDPYGITAQDLKDRLRDCIAANSEFAPYSFPALLDKLDSTSINTKRDVLVTIKACVKGYGSNTINLYSVTLWDALKFEILNIQEEDLAQEALDSLGAIAQKFVDVEGPLNSFLRPIVKECIEHLEDAPTKQSQGAGRIVFALSKISPEVAAKLARGIFPVLFSLYESSNSISKRRGLLEVYNQLIKAYLELQTTSSDFGTDAVKESAAQALEVMSRALAVAPKAEVSFRLTALKGLSQLVGVRNVLSEIETASAVDAVVEIVLHERVEGHGDIRDEAIKSLVQMAHFVPEVVRSQAIPAFMVELPDLPSTEKSYMPALEAFAQLSVEQQIFDTVCLRIKNKFNLAKHQNAPASYQHALLLSLLYAFSRGSTLLEDESTIRTIYFAEYAEPFIIQLKDALPSEKDDSISATTGRLTNVILRQQSHHVQSTVYNKNLVWMSPSTATAPPAASQVRALAPFTLYYYASLRPEVVDATDIIASLRAQAGYLLGAGQDVVGTSFVARHLALLINKFLEPKAMQTTLDEVGIGLESLLAEGFTAEKYAVAFAVVKALLVQGRCGSLTSKYLTLLIEHLPIAEKSFVRRFASLLEPDDILIKENHCTVSGLYKQKTFSQTVPPMIERLRSAEPSIKQNYLIALSGILRWLPYSVIESSLASLMPALLQSLDLSADAAHQDVKSSALTIFESVLMHNPAIAAEHSASLITRLLQSTASPSNPAKVRAKALQCLTIVPRQLKREAVIPYRRPVVKKLLACLDDAKRRVRAEAVRCRSAWLALDEGTEEGDP